MPPTDPAAAGFTPSKAARIAGWALSIILALALVFGGVIKFIRPPAFIEGFTHLGWPERYAVALGITEIVCVIVYLFPKTAVLGAVLLTGYIGGAIATHARIGEMFIVQALLGVGLWVGLYLREPRLRAVLPLLS